MLPSHTYLLVLHTAGREAFTGTAGGNGFGPLWADIGRTEKRAMFQLMREYKYSRLECVKIGY